MSHTVYTVILFILRPNQNMELLPCICQVHNTAGFTTKPTIVTFTAVIASKTVNDIS